ncbi:hypothetical protein SO802_002435 [Lithocarpus litseifolius]|uniref:Uncharacterized protein n=1 Tax=Lithocarpus litseifolius TaxID=425828 RepID=A0AAW2E2V0_9ROSI
MELIPKPVQGTLKRYWRRQRYQRLHGSKPVRKNVKITRFGGSPRRRVWRIRAVPKLRLKNFTPLKLWTKIKNAYMNMMVSLAGNVGSLNTSNVFGGRRLITGSQSGEFTLWNGQSFNLKEFFRPMIKQSGQWCGVIRITGWFLVMMGAQ